MDIMMPPPRLCRYPLGPLFTASGVAAPVGLARRLGVGTGDVCRAGKEGLTVTMAAAWCAALNFDPASLWPDWIAPTHAEVALSSRLSPRRSIVGGGLLDALHGDDSRDQTWRGQAACKGKTTLFFSYREVDRDAARTICRGCPTLEECTQDVISRPLGDDDAGVRTPFSRRKLQDMRSAMLRNREQVSS